MNVNSTSPRKSAANIRITRPVAAPPKLSGYERVRDLVAECPGNKNDRAIVLITACIEEGFTKRGQIMEVSARLGFNTNHVAVILKQDTGSNPASHRWRQDSTGTYSLHA